MHGKHWICCKGDIADPFFKPTESYRQRTRGPYCDVINEYAYIRILTATGCGKGASLSFNKIKPFALAEVVWIRQA